MHSSSECSCDSLCDRGSFCDSKLSGSYQSPRFAIKSRAPGSQSNADPRATSPRMRVQRSYLVAYSVTAAHMGWPRYGKCASRRFASSCAVVTFTRMNLAQRSWRYNLACKVRQACARCRPQVKPTVRHALEAHVHPENTRDHPTPAAHHAARLPSALWR